MCVSLGFRGGESNSKEERQESEKDTGKKEDKGEDPQVAGEIYTSFTHCFSSHDVIETCQ